MFFGALRRISLYVQPFFKLQKKSKYSVDTHSFNKVNLCFVMSMKYKQIISFFNLDARCLDDLICFSLIEFPLF